jgi:uncharacterized membrane protein
MDSLLLIFVLLALVGIVFSFMALSAIRRMEETLKPFPLNELTSRIYQLEQKLADLQKKFASINVAVPTVAQTPPEPKDSGHAEAPSPPKVSNVAVAESPKIAPQLPLPSLSRPLPKISKEASSSDLEALIGGRWFNRIGIIALLFAVSYFLKLAFDNNWIGPGGRVAIGIILGLLMLPWSDWLLSHGYTYFSEGIAGLGEATLFVSVWAGCQYYTLYTPTTGFFALILVTVIMAFLALRRNSQRIGFLSLLGGLLTPALMSTGRNEQVVLFSYLLLLSGAALFISWRKNWQMLLPLAFGGTYLYLWNWYDQFYSSAYLGSTLFFATLIFLLFSITPASRSLLNEPLRIWDILLVLANAIAYITVLYAMFWTSYRVPLALLFIVLAVAHEAIALLQPDPKPGEANAAHYLYTGLAVTCLTLALPTKLEHNAVTCAFIIEGGALVWIGFRYLGTLLRPFGYFLLFLAAGHLLLEPPPAHTFLFNERFATYLILTAALGVCLWGALQASAKPISIQPTSLLSPGKIPVYSSSPEAGVLTIAINFFALLALTQEFWDFFGGGSQTPGNSLAQHLSVSVLWTAYAAALLLLGMVRQVPILRWQSLILFGIVVLKVFFYDLSFLDRAYRIFSFFILGAALLAVSFFYQRKLARDRSGPSLSNR